MTARMRRLLSDYEQIKKDFASHQNILVTPIGNTPPERYHITYFVNGIYLLPDGSIQQLNRHEVEITLHADYPRYKPVCQIITPIWHPNFRDGQICIGDIWGAGESLSDIIINIGDMIQYKSWNSFSPLSADAAKWAIENKHLFPVGNIDLYTADYTASTASVDIDLFDDAGEKLEDEPTPPTTSQGEFVEVPVRENVNDFEITAEELAGITYTPSAQRMQTLAQASTVKGGKINLKTIVVKGLIWAFIGAFLGFLISENSSFTKHSFAAKICGYDEFVEYYELQDEASEIIKIVNKDFHSWCRENDEDPDDDDSYGEYLDDGMSSEAEDAMEEYIELRDESFDVLWELYEDEYDDFDDLADDLEDAQEEILNVSTAIWTAIIAVCIGLLLGIGEGVYYGSKEKTVVSALIGAGVSLISGLISGYIAQIIYAEMLTGHTEDFEASLIRGFAWSIMGLGIGLASGVIKPNAKRIAFCSLGGLIGGFAGGFMFNYIIEIFPDDTISRAVGIIVMGALIGLGVGLLEQFAKQAWLKVVRGEFEGKEYLVFSGTTSIGNNGQNTIVLFKDKLVSPHHCDIKLEGTRYVLYDAGSPMGTIVNGQKVVAKTVLKNGDTIAIGNSVLVFNTK